METIIDNLIDHTGEVVNGFFVVERDGSDTGGARWLIECNCGNHFSVRGSHLRKGKVRSCGCHKVSHTKLYGVWKQMRSRCNDRQHKSYKNYGGRGIEVCKEWSSFKVFSEWAKENGYREGLTLDRANNDDNYSPSNCRWTDRTTQIINRRINTNNKSGIAGVSWRENRKKWRVTIGIAYKQLSLGSYDNLYDAVIARKQAELKHWRHTKITSEQIEEIYNSQENFSKAKEDTY